jgi:hypothetical protein
MSKARTPSVEIQFGGQTRHLIRDFNALAELQDIAGTYASDVAQLKAIRAMVWALLLAETLDKRGRETSRTLSLIEVGNIIDQMEPAEVDALAAKCMEACGASDPPADPTPAVPVSE